MTLLRSLILLLVLALVVTTAAGCKVDILHGSSAATAVPVGTADSYDGFGNTQLVVNAASGVLANDTGGGLSAAVVATTPNGTLVLNADGSFTYTPDTTNRGATDTFTYNVTNTLGTDGPITVTINLSGFVWYVDNSLGSNGNGSSSSPFNSVANFNAGATDQTSDIIYLHTGSGDYDGAITLLDSQQLIGEGVALMVGASTLRSAASTPSFVNTGGGDAISLGAGNTVSGINFGNTGNGYGISTAAAAGVVTISSVAFSGTGGAIQLSGGTSAGTSITITSIAVTSSSARGVNLENFNGSFTVSGTTTIGTTTNEGIRIVNPTATGSITFTGTTTISAATTAAILMSGVVSGAQVSFGTVGISAQPSGAVGVQITNPAGTIGLGAVTISSPVSGAGIGVQVSGQSAGTTTFSSANVSDADADGIDVSSQSGGTLNLGTVTVDDVPTGSIAIDITNQTGGTTQCTSTTVNATNTRAGTGININNCASGTLTFGTTGVTSVAGIAINSSTSAINFNNLTINANGGTGYSVANSGPIANPISHTGTAAAVTVVDGNGVVINNSRGDNGSTNGWEFGAITVSGTATVTGILLVNLPVDFDSTSVTIDGIDGLAINVNNSGGASQAITFGTTTIGSTTAVNQGVSLVSNTGATITFTSLAITTNGDGTTPNGGVGFVANGSGTVVFLTADPTITTVDGATIELINTSCNSVAQSGRWTFTTLTSTSSGNNLQRRGIFLQNLTQGVTVTGTTTITNWGEDTTGGGNWPGIEIDTVAATVTFAGLIMSTSDNDSNEAIDAAAMGASGSLVISSDVAGNGITYTGTTDVTGILVGTRGGTGISSFSITGTSGNPFTISGVGLDNTEAIVSGPWGVGVFSVTGNVTIDTITVTNTGETGNSGDEHAIFVEDPGNSSTVTITGCTVTENVDGSGIVVGNSTATRPTVSITNNTCGTVTNQSANNGNNLQRYGIVVGCDGNGASMVATVTGNTIQNQGAANSGGGILVSGDNDAGTGASNQMSVRIGQSGAANTISNRTGSGILVISEVRSVMRVMIDSNNISFTALAAGEDRAIGCLFDLSGGATGDAMLVDVDIQNNTIDGYDQLQLDFTQGVAPIVISADLGTNQEQSQLVTRVQGTTFTNTNVAMPGVLIFDDNSFTNDTGNLDVTIESNNFSNTGGIVHEMGGNDTRTRLNIATNTGILAVLVDEGGQGGGDASELQIGDYNVGTAPDPGDDPNTGNNLETVLEEATGNNNNNLTVSITGGDASAFVNENTIARPQFP